MTTAAPALSEVVSLTEAAKLLGVSETSVRKYAAQGKLTAQPDEGGRRRFLRVDVEAAVDRLKADMWRGGIGARNREIRRLAGMGTTKKRIAELQGVSIGTVFRVLAAGE